MRRREPDDPDAAEPVLAISPGLALPLVDGWRVSDDFARSIR